ncbi:EAL domain-containing protein [Maricaulis parjimensis]|uniref:EAL domain-containing protein n=1 Tax=Maricaulis parjimensis TaxID=144023 RepID=UPI00193A77E0|nr:EAL domain-containing protein [Maricaulis parjimensis]
MALSPVAVTAAASAQSATETPDTFYSLIETARSSMMRAPQDALDLADAAEQQLETDVSPADHPQARATLNWLRSEALTRLGRPVEAEPYAQQALRDLGDNPEATQLYADILVAMARVERITGRYGLALEHFQAAYTVYRQIDAPRSEAIVLLSIASIYRDAHQYERAVDYFLDASNRYDADPSLELAAHNNLGNAYREMGDFEAALDHFTQARNIAIELDSAMLEARILSNLAALYVDMGDFTAADEALDTSFEQIGPDGADWARFLWGVRAQAAFGRGEVSAAQAMIGRTFDDQNLEETTQSFREFHEAAADIYEAAGQTAAALPHLRAFKRLDDEARAVAASANNALLGAQFDFAEQELQIEQLRSESLQQELTLADTRARQQLYIVFGLLGLAAICLVSGGLYYRVLRQRNAVLRDALYRDMETGLPTRFAAESRVEALDLTGMDPVVMALGIDRYQHLESVLGFDRMAELTRVVADRLKQDEDVDMAVVLSRGALGIVLTRPAMRSLEEVAQELQSLLAEPLHVDDVTLDVAVTLGVASDESRNACTREAMLAVEQAREANQSFCMFDAGKQQDHSDNLTLMSRMLAATSSGHMQMHYQPKLHLKSGEFRAAEALVRWNDPERGFIPPDAFIGLAEETGRIREFTEWSLDRVVTDQKSLMARGQDIQISINISGALISDPDFGRIALDRVAAARGRISFEITETAAMGNPERALQTLRMWRDAGIKLSIDDYGTGLSSLAYLRSLPAEELKLDRAFVSNIASSQRDRMLVKSTTDLAHALGLEMTAEGVEDEAGLALLKMLGCDWAQGYLMSRALPLDALRHFLASHTEGWVVTSGSQKGRFNSVT